MRRPRLAVRVPMACVLLVVSTATAQIVHDVTLTVAPGRVSLDPGWIATAWLADGMYPGPVLRAREGDTLRVRFRNQVSEETTLHWHGLATPLRMDGVVDEARPAVAPGQEFTYVLEDLPAGTYWYHPHVRSHIERGPIGAIVIEPANPALEEPFDVERLIVLTDWYNPFGDPGAPIKTHTLNGRTSAGQTPIPVQLGQRVKFRIVNASSERNMVFQLDGHTMTVTHADGHRVVPVPGVEVLPIGIGERWDVIVPMTNPGTWSFAVVGLENRSLALVRGIVRYQGSTVPDPAATWVPPALRTGPLFTYDRLIGDEPTTPIRANPDRRLQAELDQDIQNLIFTINGHSWPNVPPFQVRQGETVELEAWTAAGSMQPHPMHLHGHHVRLVGTQGGTASPPVKDTVLVYAPSLPQNRVAVQFTADNPGNWLYHCHHLAHMQFGMMMALEYLGDTDGDGLEDPVDAAPTDARPTLALPMVAAAYRVGASGTLLVQWAPGQRVDGFLGNALDPPLDLGDLGRVALWPILPFGSANLGTGRTVRLSYLLPADPSLIGGAVTLQAGGTTSLAPGYRISPPVVFTILP